MIRYNQKDFEIYNTLFADIPGEWKEAPPTTSMIACKKFFKSKNVNTILDIGCGPGIWSMYLARQGFKVNGFDFSPNAIRFAEEWASEEEVGVEFEVGSVLTPPFKEKTFDAILAAKIIDNIPEEELDAIIALIDERLKEGGYLFALFNPEEIPPELESDNNPTKETSSIKFADQEIRSLFRGYSILNFREFEAGFRGLMCIKQGL